MTSAQNEPIERLLTVSNAVVVQLPERRHPGVVIQGDSLGNILSLLHGIEEAIESRDLTEAKEQVREILEIIVGYYDVIARCS